MIQEETLRHKDPDSITKITSISVIRSAFHEEDNDGHNPRIGQALECNQMFSGSEPGNAFVRIQSFSASKFKWLPQRLLASAESKTSEELGALHHDASAFTAEILWGALCASEPAVQGSTRRPHRETAAGSVPRPGAFVIRTLWAS